MALYECPYCEARVISAASHDCPKKPRKSDRERPEVIGRDAPRKAQGRQEGSTPPRLASLPNGTETGPASPIRRGRPRKPIDQLSRSGRYRRKAEAEKAKQ